MSRYQFKKSATPSSGTWSGNTDNIFNGICCQVYVKPATSTTSFDLTIQDSSGVRVRSFTAAVKEINDLAKWPVRGIYTITISNASVDEAFDILMLVEEF